MSFAALKEETYSLFNHYPFLYEIDNEDEYDQAMELMEELIDDDNENNYPLINLVSNSIEKWETNSKEFADFYNRQKEIDQAVATLKILIEQHNLTLDDFENEIGKKSYVSQILNGNKKLSIKHIRKLSERFDIPASYFI